MVQRHAHLCISTCTALAVLVAAGLAGAPVDKPLANKGSPSRAPEEMRLPEGRPDNTPRKDRR